MFHLPRNWHFKGRSHQNGSNAKAQTTYREARKSLLDLPTQARMMIDNRMINAQTKTGSAALFAWNQGKNECWVAREEGGWGGVGEGGAVGEDAQGTPSRTHARTHPAPSAMHAECRRAECHLGRPIVTGGSSCGSTALLSCSRCPQRTPVHVCRREREGGGMDGRDCSGAGDRHPGAQIWLDGHRLDYRRRSLRSAFTQCFVSAAAASGPSWT